MNDTSSQLPLMRGSDDWYDYFTYPDVVKNIGRQNLDFMKRLLESIDKQEELIGGLNADIASLEEDKTALEAEKAEFERQAEELEREKSELEQSVAEKHSELFRLTEANDDLRSRISGAEERHSRGRQARGGDRRADTRKDTSGAGGARSRNARLQRRRLALAARPAAYNDLRSVRTVGLAVSQGGGHQRRQHSGRAYLRCAVGDGHYSVE